MKAEFPKQNKKRVFMPKPNEPEAWTTREGNDRLGQAKESEKIKNKIKNVAAGIRAQVSTATTWNSYH